MFSKISDNLSKTKKIKFTKEECKKLFHIENRKIPSWAQFSEWPIRNGVPCKFIRQHKICEKVQYFFLDVNTNVEVIVEQYY